MTLIKSISGIRGTIGGKPGDTLSPLDAVNFAAAYGTWLRKNRGKQTLKVVMGRDARPSGSMIQSLVENTLLALGIDVLDCGLSTTPTVEMMVPHFEADGGIILTASHNPVNWNALKLLNHHGEFLNGDDGKEILKLVEAKGFEFVEVENLGKKTTVENAIDLHIEKIMAHPWVDAKAVRNSNFSVAIDAVNSTGGISIPPMLEALGVTQIHKLYCEPNGEFPHNPEPLEQNLAEIMAFVKEKNCDLGVVVDPDVDRLALIDENGAMFGEEYTLVAAADFVLSQKKGHVVSNLSSSRALRDLAQQSGGTYSPAAVGEVNVVEEMKKTKAVIGGEGNGGVIFPELHYGRDALVGVAFILTHMAKTGKTLSELKSGYPAYFMAKEKVALSPGLDVDGILKKMETFGKSNGAKVDTRDGVKMDYEEGWVHLRKSNTEPIIRIYTEAKSAAKAKQMADETLAKIEEIAG